MIPAVLRHDTGTIIRFRPRQLVDLPSGARDIRVLLPNGELVEGHFNPHPRNPNISGAGVVRYIKKHVPLKSMMAVLVETRTKSLWVLHPMDEAVGVAGSASVRAHVKQGSLGAQDLASLMALADRERSRGRRVGGYTRVLRPSGLRRLMLGVVGAKCMVQQCDACERFDDEWGPESGSEIVEVHHVEHVARVIDHYPRNLCVLCANHHRFVHGSGEWKVMHDGPNVIFKRDGREMTLVRPAIFFQQ
jgi:hypothetical protein